MIFHLLAANPVDLGPALTQIGIGALIAVPAYATAWKLWQRNSTREAKIDELQLLRVQDAKEGVERERELADRLGPLLAEAARILATAPERFDQALNQVQTATRTSEVDGIMRRLEQTVSHLGRERQQP